MSSLAKGPGLKNKAKLKHIGQYGIGKTLGQGSFSKVKLGTDVFTGEKVAIKIVDWAHVPDVEDTSESLEREIRIMKLFDHPNIVKLYDIITHKDDRKTYLIMEYVSRGELFDYIVANGRIKEPESRKYFRQLVSAVEYCHAFLVVHRDLKPSNLLLDHGGSIKLVDFGLSNQIQVGQLFSTWCGSLYYSAPEIIEEKRYAGPAVDLWSVGVILYALVNGRLPWAGKNDLEKIRQIVAADIAPSEPGVTADCMDLIKGCLAVDPAQRFDMLAVREHRWTNEGYAQPPPCLVPKTQPVPKVSQEAVQQLAFLGFIKNTAEAKAAATLAIQTNERTQVVYAYRLLLSKPQLPVTGSYLPRDLIRQSLQAGQSSENKSASSQKDSADETGAANAATAPADADVAAGGDIGDPSSVQSKKQAADGDDDDEKAEAAAAFGDASPGPPDKQLQRLSGTGVAGGGSSPSRRSTPAKEGRERKGSTGSSGKQRAHPHAIKKREDSMDLLVSDLDKLLMRKPAPGASSSKTRSRSIERDEKDRQKDKAATVDGGSAAAAKPKAPRVSAVKSMTMEDMPKSKSMSSSDEQKRAVTSSSPTKQQEDDSSSSSSKTAGPTQTSIDVEPGRRRASSTSASIISRRSGGGSNNRPPLPIGLLTAGATADGEPLKYTDVLKAKLLGGSRVGPAAGDGADAPDNESGQPATIATSSVDSKHQLMNGSGNSSNSGPMNASSGNAGSDANDAGADGGASSSKASRYGLPPRLADTRIRSASVGVNRAVKPSLSVLAAAAVDADEAGGGGSNNNNGGDTAVMRMSSKRGLRGSRASYSLGVRGRADSMMELPNPKLVPGIQVQTPVVDKASGKKQRGGGGGGGGATAGSTWDATTYANAKKRRASKAGGHEKSEDMRTVRGVFKCSTTSSRPPEEIMAAVEQALIVAGHYKYKRRGFVFKCMDKHTKTRIEVETCMIEKLDGIYGIRFARLAGDTWVYKTLIEQLMTNVKL